MPGRIGYPLLTLLATLALAGTARAQSPVPLGGADPFAVLAGTAVTNAGSTVITGDLGVSPGATVSGFPPGVVNGTFHIGDSAAAQGQLDLANVYNNASGQAVTATIPTQLGETVLPPGVYDSNSGTFDITGTLSDVIVDGTDRLLARLELTAATALPPVPGDQFTITLVDSVFLSTQGGVDINADASQLTGTVTISEANTVPEPASLTLFCLGGVGLAAAGRRARRQTA